MCFRWYSLRSHLFIADVIIIIFILTTLLWNIFQAFRSLPRSLLTFLSLRSFLFTSFHVFLGRPLMKLPLTLKVLHLLGQALSSILSKRPNHCSLLSCKQSFMLFSFFSSPKFHCRNPILRPSVAHLSNNPSIIHPEFWNYCQHPLCKHLKETFSIKIQQNLKTFDLYLVSLKQILSFYKNQ